MSVKTNNSIVPPMEINPRRGAGGFISQIPGTDICGSCRSIFRAVTIAPRWQGKLTNGQIPLSMTVIKTSSSEEELQTLTPIQSFFKDKSIFLTGGSGFLGKVLTEKLLRCCPGIKTIYFLIRAKKGKSEEERLKEVLSDVLYDELRKKNPQFTDSIVPIPGDCKLPGLGISEESRKLLIENVNVVFHAAATVRFDENLKVAFTVNVNATQEVLNLCYSIKNLASVVHVSTAYSFCHLNIVKEDVGEWSPDFDKTLKMAKELTEEEIASVTPSVLGTWPNTYTLTKAFAESLVKKVEGQLPICIFRPAIVTSTFHEPVPGWLDNYFGPTGIVVGAGCGVVRAVHCNANVEANLVPADYVINGMLAAAYETHKSFRAEEKNKIQVYNFVSSADNPLSYKELKHSIAKYGITIPSVKAVWYYSLTMCSSKSQTYILWLLLHWLPAFLVDVAAVLTGRKPVMMKLYNRIHKMIKVVAYFATRRWSFQTDNVKSLWEKTSERDKKIFYFDVRGINWESYLKNYIEGARKYILKEDMSTLAEARKKWNRLYWYHQILKMIFGVLALTIFWYSVRKLVSAAYF